jgi:hypothetical protein
MQLLLNLMNVCHHCHSSEYLSFYVLNPTSLAKCHAVQQLQVDVRQQNSDVVIICESWFNEKIDSKVVAIEGYNLFRKDRHKRKGGGVCCYIRNAIKTEIIWPSTNSDAEIEILVLKSVFRMQVYFIICCYHPPKPHYSADQFRSAVDSIFNFINRFDDDSAIIVFAGDLNSLDDSLICDVYGLVQLVTTPTHDNNILDRFFTNRPDIYTNCSTFRSTLKTKHLAVIVYSGVERRTTSPSRRKVLLSDIRAHNIDKLRYVLASNDWSALLNCTDIRLLYTRFLAICKYFIHCSIPTRTVTLRHRDPDYVTPYVKYLLRKRYTLRRKGRSEEANLLAQKINDTISNIRSKRLSNLQNAPSKILWKSVAPRTRDNNCDVSNSILYDIDSACDFFANISFDSAYNVDKVMEFSKLPQHVHVGQYLTATDISSVTVERLLRSIKSTSPGTDGLPSWFFNSCSVELADIVCHIINCSLTSGIIPSQWSTALVTLIPKVHSPLELGDFRPISVTPILSRLVEKLVIRQWLRPAIPNSIIADQFAFKPTGSTTAALVYLMHHVTKLLETNGYVRCLLVDFSKAFDIVDQAIIVRKLSMLPLPWNIINWIISFLTDRKIQLKRGDIISHPKQINRGIVQGSGIGPTLYIVHESDLIPMSLVNILLKYADDTNLLVPENTDITLSQEFDNIKTWAFHNKMIINFNKTKELVFYRPNPYHSVHPLPVDDIEQLLEAKVLGVFINGKFHFDSHLQFLMRQCSQRLYLLKMLRKQGLAPKQLGIVFQALIISRIQYAISAWGGFVHSDWKRKIDAFLLRAHRSGLCTNLTFDTLLFAADQTLFTSICNNEHCLHHILPAIKSNQYDLRNRGHELKLPEYKTLLYKKSFLPRHLFQTV